MNTHGKLALSIAAAILLCGVSNCLVDPSDDSPALVCPHAGEQVPYDTFDPLYKVVSPNGGEIFHVGQACSLKITSQHEGNASLSIRIGRHSFDIPGLTRALTTPTDSLVVFTVPDSFSTLEYDPVAGQTVQRKYCSSTDSCLVVITDYNNENYLDCSDCYFSIGE